MSRALGYLTMPCGCPPKLCAALQELMNLKDNQQARLAKLDAQVELVDGRLASLQVGRFAMLLAEISLLFRRAESVAACTCPLEDGEHCCSCMQELARTHPFGQMRHREQGGGHATVESLVLQSHGAR